MRKYATITLQVASDDGLPVLDHITDGKPILGVSLVYTDDLYVDPTAQLRALADELEAETEVRRVIQAELDAERYRNDKLEGRLNRLGVGPQWHKRIKS